VQELGDAATHRLQPESAELGDLLAREPLWVAQETVQDELPLRGLVPAEPRVGRGRVRVAPVPAGADVEELELLGHVLFLNRKKPALQGLSRAALAPGSSPLAVAQEEPARC
jgi:hypothetical protein